MIRGVLAAVAIAASLCARTALAQDAQPESPPAEPPPHAAPGDPVDAMVGTWELSNADRDKICRLNFRADALADGHRVDIDKNCQTVFPSTKDIVGWTLDNYGSLRLFGTDGEAVLELSEVESGMFDGFKPEEGRYILQAAAALPVRSADEMFGDWAIARATGKPICTLTLANGAAGADSFALRLKPGCDAAVMRFGPTTWRIDHGELVLLSPRGQSWRFEENDADTWQRVPETPDPILLVRQ